MQDQLVAQLVLPFAKPMQKMMLQQFAIVHFLLN
jgi:hypothetical protein